MKRKVRSLLGDDPFIKTEVLLLVQAEDSKIQKKELSLKNYRKGAVITFKETGKIIKVEEVCKIIYEKEDQLIAPFLKENNLVFEGFKYGDIIIKTKDDLILIRGDKDQLLFK